MNLAATVRPVVKRIIFIFLLLLLPSQAVWAAASTYCQHERGAAAKHFGHHVHQHQLQADDSPATGKAPGSLDLDCSACHLGAPAVPVTSQGLTLVESQSLLAPHPPGGVPTTYRDRPERPNWSLVS